MHRADRTEPAAAITSSRTLAAMKYVVLVPDGCADEPVDELDGKTPLEAAALPEPRTRSRRAARSAGPT